jgi:hypothetical protein
VKRRVKQMRLRRKGQKGSFIIKYHVMPFGWASFDKEGEAEEDEGTGGL